MAIKQKRNTTVYAKIQANKGEAAVIAAANALDPVGDSPFVQAKGDLINRGLIRGSRYPSKSVVGGRWGEGSLNLELRGSGVAGTAPEFGPLMLTLLGSELTNAAGTVADIAATTTEFDSALSLTVGQLVRVAIGTGYEVRRIAGKSGGGPYTYTVQRAFSQAPADTAAITAGVTYTHLGGEAEKYFTLDQYLDGLRLLCIDAVCESLAFGVTEREVIKGQFGVRSLSCAESAAADALTPDWDDTAPLIGTECNLLVGAAALNMKAFDFSLASRRTRGGVNTTGFGEAPWKSEFEATGKLTPWVEDAAPLTAFFASTSADIEMTKGAVAGNILHVLLEDIEYTGADIGDDEGDFAWDLPFKITGAVSIGLF
jgi:hypothetical protein